MLGKVWSFHGDYEECRLLGCGSCKNLRRSSIIRVTRIGQQGTTLAVTNNRSTLFLARWFLSPWWRREYILPKRRFLEDPHGVTSQKTACLSVVSSVTNPTWTWPGIGLWLLLLQQEPAAVTSVYLGSFLNVRMSSRSLVHLFPHLSVNDVRLTDLSCTRQL
jgi:hypothetical protein